MTAFLLLTTYSTSASFIPRPISTVQVWQFWLGSFLLWEARSFWRGAKTSGDIYIDILKSHSIARVLVERFHLLSVYKDKKESQGEKTLASHTDFTVGAKDTMVTISVTAIAWAKSCPRVEVMLYDNTLGAILEALPEGVHYVVSSVNAGLSTAYNRAAAWAASADFDWLLTLDQDTLLPELFWNSLPQLQSGNSAIPRWPQLFRSCA